MMTKEEIDIILAILNSAMILAEKIDPNLEKNNVIIAVNKAIRLLQGLGL